MESQCAHENGSGKRPYSKPRVRKIELLAEEVLGIGCKRDIGDLAMGTGHCASTACNMPNPGAS